MNIDLLYWNQVTVVCATDQSKNLTFSSGRVFLRLQDASLTTAPDRHVLLGRAKLVELTTKYAIFDAAWVEGSALNPVRVTALF